MAKNGGLDFLRILDSKDALSRLELAAVADLMNDVLPAWEDWETYSGWLYADGGPDGTSNPDTSALAE